MKTYKDWNGSRLNLDQFLQIGDEVDDQMYWYFLEVLPPATMRADLVQIGEPYSHVNGRATFSTLRRENRRWIYAGHCHQGEREAAPEVCRACFTRPAQKNDRRCRECMDSQHAEAERATGVQ